MKAILALKNLIVFFVSLIVFILNSCQKDKLPNTLPEEIIGKWVEANTLSDTIFFNTNSTNGGFSLHRGYEIRNGYRLPIIGSTIYFYEIIGDSIKVVDGLSSSAEGGTYYFHFDKPNLTLATGKFSKYIDTNKSILTFRKIN